MKIKLNRSFIIVSLFLMLSVSCSEQNKDNITGVYLCNYEYQRYGIMDYVVLFKNGSYKRIYIYDNDTLLNSNTWEKVSHKNTFMLDNSTDIHFHHWKHFGIEKHYLEQSFKSENDISNVIMTLNRGVLSFIDDIDLNFIKIDSLKMIEYGIVESIY